MSKYQGFEHRVAIEDSNNSIVCNDALCKKCQLCKKTCTNDAGVYGTFDLEKNGDIPICINCGQCAVACPFGAITELSAIDQVNAEIKNKDKITVFITAPAVRISLGDAFGMEPGKNVEKKMVSALRKLGADYVMDVVFAADLTIMEEAAELVWRLQNGGKLPMFTSCCPSWVKYCEIYFPELLGNLSTAKSPIAMMSTIIKTYWAKKMNIDPAKICVVSVTPCTSKKSELTRPELSAAMKELGLPGRDNDVSITTRELAKMIKTANIDFANLEDGEFDSAIGTGSGAGLIFGNTGGVMEAALRTAYFMIEGKNPDEETFLSFQKVRGIDNLKEATVVIGGKTLHVAAVNQMGFAKDIVREVLEGQRHYDFVEVMACKGGCANGGGQVKILKRPVMEQARVERNKTLYDFDKTNTVRFSHENPEIKVIYDEYFGAPQSHRAHELLHTSYIDKSYQLGKK